MTGLEPSGSIAAGHGSCTEGEDSCSSGDSCGLGTHGRLEWLVEMRKTFECHVKQSIYLYILILTLKYKPLPRKLCTGPQSNCVR